jgi:hypothetical protein
MAGDVISGSLCESFDCVVMLTWSNWFTEPRSNRYHYATRFARHLPVLFVQPNDWPNADILRAVATEHNRLEVIELSTVHAETSQNELETLLRARGLKRPLIWIYNARDFQSFVRRRRNSLRVFHATEDFLTPSDAWNETQSAIAAEMRRHVLEQLRHVDLVVTVSPALASTYRSQGAFDGRIIVARNGCDAEFFEAIRREQRPAPKDESSRPIAVYQGAVNRRLDFDLLHELVHRLPDWEFVFCGRADSSLADWTNLLAHPNVRYLGELDAQSMARTLCDSTVGLIPFRQIPLMQDSLPLKAFEYVASGLPVVTVPITALNDYPDVFTFAASAGGFENALRRLRDTKQDPRWLMVSRAVAEQNSYDRRFAEVVVALREKKNSLARRLGKLNILILYDDRWSHIRTILEHIDSFRKYSRHQIYLVPASGTNAPDVDLELFDVVIHHYAVRLSLPWYMNDRLARRLSAYEGLKILFIQDEYDTTETARQWIERLKFDIVYTCVPAEGREAVYPKFRFPWVEFLPTLTGYVPEADDLDGFARPMLDRQVRIGYRGRMLSYFYGKLGYEKFRIGVDVRRLAEERGVAVDIEVDDRLRIYGADWYRFLGSVRATLGTESGANIFDFDGLVSGDVQRYLSLTPAASFEEVFEALLEPHEGLVRMNQVSPKIFEAIRLRTALILFEGSYSGVVEPDRHYIPLKKDYSNIDDVFRKLEDLDYLEGITERASCDVVGSGRYSYRSFVEAVDRDIERRVLRRHCEIYATPVLARSKHELTVVLPRQPIDYGVSTGVLHGDFQREQLVGALASRVTVPGPQPPRSVVRAPEPQVIEQLPAVAGPPRSGLPAQLARGAWRFLPVGFRSNLRVRLINLVQRARKDASSQASDRLLQKVWRVTMPQKLRHRVLSALSRR